MPGRFGMTDLWDGLLGQATVVSYAIPGVGPLLASGFSIAQAIYDAARPGEAVPSDYSTAQAIADLGQRVHDELYAMKKTAQLETVLGWQQDIVNTDHDTGKVATTHPIGSLEEETKTFYTVRDFNHTFAEITDTDAGSEERVRSLLAHFTARTAFHSLCMAKLRYLAKAYGLNPDTGWTSVDSVARDQLDQSLHDAPIYARATVATLDDTYRHAAERAQAAAASQTDAPTRNAAFTEAMRASADTAHLRYASRRDVTSFLQFLQLYDQAAATLAAAPSIPDTGTPTPQAGQTTTTTTSGGTPVTTATLGPRPVGVVRFLYERDAKRSWVDVVADSPVASGGLATQNAGSTLHSIYYQFGGDPINGLFATQLAAAGQLGSANKTLVKAYDAHYKAVGAWTADSTPKSPRQDRLTSFLVPIPPDTPPIGKSVLAVLYSVGPQLGAKGIEDEPAYQQIYADAFAAIADWNQRWSRQIENFRVTMLSTGIFGGTSDRTLLRAQAARLIVDAAVAAVNAAPQWLGTLTVLVNTNDAAGGVERIAFDSAAAGRKLVTTPQGFDVPLS